VRPDLQALPPALTTDLAAELLGLSADSLERAAKRGDAPVPFYRWGRSLRWPAEPIRRLLNGEGAAEATPPTTPVLPTLAGTTRPTPEGASGCYLVPGTKTTC